MKGFERNLAFSAFSLIAVSSSGTALAGSTETILHSFVYATGDGPTSGVSLDPSTDALYGIASRNGGVYEVLPPNASNPNWTYNLIYSSFSGGTFPQNLIVANGIVYFNSYSGGSGCASLGCGGVYSLTPQSGGTGEWTLNTLYQFAGGSDGASPIGSLAIDGEGAIFGTAESRGTGCHKQGGCGTAFKLTPPQTEGQSWSFSVIYHFSGSKAGQQPLGVIADRYGNLYGQALFNQSENDNLIYELIPPSGDGEWTETVLYRFYRGSTNCAPSGDLAVDSNGALYGIVGGTCQYVFQLAPSVSSPEIWIKTEMYDFNSHQNTSGYGLTAPLTVDSGGNVYGATTQGIDSAYVLEPRPGVPGKWNYKLLYKLGNAVVPNGGLVIDSSGNILGTTGAGGAHGNGAVYELTP